MSSSPRICNVSSLTVAIYVALGGLRSAIFNEVLQFILIWAGAALIPIMGLIETGGWSNLKAQITHNASNEYVHLWSTLGSFHNNPMGIHWTGIVFGLGAIISFGYWTTDFLVVQRVLAAKDLRAAKMAPIIGAAFKMMVPIIVILPGLLGLAVLPVKQSEFRLKTSLTPEQVRESFATPETVPFWELPQYIQIAEHAGLVAAGYRLQFQKLLARPFLLAAMVLLAAAVSLRFFRFGGIQKMVLSGIAAGFLLYVLSKVTEDLSKAELMHPIAAAWLPVCVGGLTGFLALLYQEDG